MFAYAFHVRNLLLQNECKEAVLEMNQFQGLRGMRQEGIAILMVTNDLEIVKRFATRVWRVQGGRVNDAGKEGIPHASYVPTS
jgi:ABC-type microcin C transport system duplicated ATPase subunit YejF